jgi:excisionase family DNA binding protein
VKLVQPFQWDHVSQALDDIAFQVREAADCARLIGELERVKTILNYRLIALAKTATASFTARECLLTAEEAAQKLSVSKDYVYRHSSKLPFTVKVGGNVRFSNEGIDRYIKGRQGHP